MLSLGEASIESTVELDAASGLVNEARLRLQLPEAASDAKIESATLRIAIDARGQYFINDKQLLNASNEALRTAMQQAVGGKKDPVIVVQADRKTPHEAVIRVMEVSRRLGYTHLTFATQAPGPEQ